MSDLGPLSEREAGFIGPNPVVEQVQRVMSNGESNTDVRSIRNELLTLTREDAWDQDDLIETAAANMGVSEVSAEEALDHLLTRGEVYRVTTEDGWEVRHT